MEGEGGGGGDDLMEFGERWVQRSELLAFEKGCILDTCAHGCETNPPSSLCGFPYRPFQA